MITAIILGGHIRKVLYHSAVLEKIVTDCVQELLEGHHRVRTAARLKRVRYKVALYLPPDVIGIYV